MSILREKSLLTQSPSCTFHHKRGTMGKTGKRGKKRYVNQNKLNKEASKISQNM